ncbi:MAG: hypothetical protein ACOY9J_08690 [Pseudomonadota bacterium]
MSVTPSRTRPGYFVAKQGQLATFASDRDEAWSRLSGLLAHLSPYLDSPRSHKGKAK